MTLSAAAMVQCLRRVLVLIVVASGWLWIPGGAPVAWAEVLDHETPVRWAEIEAGFAYAHIELSPGGSLLRSPIVLLRFSPTYFSFHAVTSAALELPPTDVRRLTELVGGVAGINANFFDPSGEPLGLVVSGGVVRKKLQTGGDLLTGVFLVENGVPRIFGRAEMQDAHAQMAIQAGPRLIVQGRPTELSAPLVSSRRSGIAISRRGDVILYATELRFPGATLAEVQTMLLNPSLEILDALNLDGGGSSQLYLGSSTEKDGGVFISGGDPVPVALVVKRKAESSQP